ncbi:FtsX-like permease family protein [Shiella aurantiaca]
MNPQSEYPPKIFLKILKWFCPTKLHESVEGDLWEEFEFDLQRFGIRRARRRFAWNVVRFFRPAILLRHTNKRNIIYTDMLRSYFTITFRNLYRNASYSIINIIGLAIGMAACLLIWNYVEHETSFDTFHPDVERTYRVDQTSIWNPEGGIMGSTGPAVAEVLLKNYPEIQEVMRINTPGGDVMRFEPDGGVPTVFMEEKILAADSNFFNFFGIALQEGNSKSALSGINKVVISPKAAARHFGEGAALGKILLWGENKIPLEVTGITESLPANMHFSFDYLISMYSNPSIKRFDWSFIWTQMVTYIKLKPEANAVELQYKMAEIGERNIKPTFSRLGIDYHDFIRDKGGWNFVLQPVANIHLYTVNSNNRIGAVSDIKYIYIFSIVGLFVLLIAVINFVNLSTARASTRAKEVGVKKSLGAFKSSLIGQFQVESITIAFLALIIALGLAELMRWLIGPLSDVHIPFTLWKDGKVFWVLPLTTLLIGFLAGLYPSFYLTNFNPAQVLKGRIASGLKNKTMRHTLVLIQFTISITLMTGSLVVYQQLNYLKTKNLGFDKGNILVLNAAEKMGNQLESFQQELQNMPGVTTVTRAMTVPGGGAFEDIFMKEKDDTKLPIGQVKIDEHYFKTFGLSLVAGRTFDKNRLSDKEAIILNETAVKLLGWTPETALGENLIYPEIGKLEVIGVVKDFHFQSLYLNISPLVFLDINSPMWGDQRVLAIRFNSTSPKVLLESIENRWHSLSPDVPFQYSFLNEALESQYREDERMGGLFSLFTGISILVAMIGLVGLVAYSVEQRKREIGVRKVFGASTGRIFYLINKQYLILIVMALLLAMGISWWPLSHWLESFVYRITVNPLLFVLATIIEIVLAVTCVGYLSYRAAISNPAKVLKED